MRLPRISLAGLALAVAGCAEPSTAFRAADPSFQSFVDTALPVLIRDCGFHTCHGSSNRFFRVYGPGRVRLDPTARAFDKLSPDEWEASYEAAASMVDARNPDASLLLRKPLSIAAGGASHGGVDKFGRNVYRSITDDGFVALRGWVFTHNRTGTATTQ